MYKYIVFADCGNLSDEERGEMFESQAQMDEYLQSVSYKFENCVSKLEKYTVGMKMVPEKMYRTVYAANYDCCLLHVIKTSMPVESLSDGDVRVPNISKCSDWNEMFKVKYE